MNKKDVYEKVCDACITLAKRDKPNIKGCAFRCLGNEFCNEVEQKAKQYGFYYLLQQIDEQACGGQL